MDITLRNDASGIEFAFTENIFGVPMVIGSKPIEVGEPYYVSGESRIATEQEVSRKMRNCILCELVTKEQGNAMYKELVRGGYKKVLK